MNELLKLENISVTFQARTGLFGSVNVKALDGVSLSLNKGETLSIVGESGSGKTTLGRVSLKLVDPSEGNVLFNGIDLNTMNNQAIKHFRRQAQGIFQDPYSSLNGFMTIYEILEEPLIVHGYKNRLERNEIVHSVLESVKLLPITEVAQKYPHMLSGGLRQRVGIARALTLNPEYILADEPVSMIDASNRAEILYLMKNLQQKYGISYIYITHDIATARHFSDKIAIMYAGRIIETGTPEEIIDDPLHPYTKALINAIPEANAKNRMVKREVILGEPPRPSNLPNGCSFHPRCPSVIFGKCDTINPEATSVNGREVKCHLYPDSKTT